MDVVTLRDLADGAATLRIDPDGVPENPLTIVDLDTPVTGTPPEGQQGVVVGVGEPTAEVLPWLTTVAAPDEVSAIAETVQSAPLAGITLAGLLTATASSTVQHALMSESLAYSMLLAGSEFRCWRDSTPRREVPAAENPVLVERDGDTLSIVLNRPERHNAFGAAVRNGLLDGLAVAALDTTIGEVVVSGSGPSFSSGGDLDEFGTADDVARAHATRQVASAGWAVHRIRDRVHVRLHGACLGAGVEVPAFAGRVTAGDDAYFGLPELQFGLIPGAGGTVSLPRRIGRHRTAWLALTRFRIGLDTALEWGLVDEYSR